MKKEMHDEKVTEIINRETVVTRSGEKETNKLLKCEKWSAASDLQLYSWSSETSVLCSYS